MLYNIRNACLKHRQALQHLQCLLTTSSMPALQHRQCLLTTSSMPALQHRQCLLTTSSFSLRYSKQPGCRLQSTPPSHHLHLTVFPATLSQVTAFSSASPSSTSPRATAATATTWRCTSVVRRGGCCSTTAPTWPRPRPPPVRDSGYASAVETPPPHLASSPRMPSVRKA